MRLIPASSAIAMKLQNERSTPGSPSEVVVKLSLLPKKLVKTVAAAPLKVLCPDRYSGKGGVSSSSFHAGAACV